MLGGSQEKAVERELENSCRAESGKEEKNKARGVINSSRRGAYWDVLSEHTVPSVFPFNSIIFRADLVPADQKSFVSARPIPVPLVD